MIVRYYFKRSNLGFLAKRKTVGEDGNRMWNGHKYQNYESRVNMYFPGPRSHQGRGSKHPSN